jgi:hypothetical protein
MLHGGIYIDEKKGKKAERKVETMEKRRKKGCQKENKEKKSFEVVAYAY